MDFGPLGARVVGDAAVKGGTVVVLLHGFGAPGDDLVPLAPLLSGDSSVRFVFPEAPIALPPIFGEARAWWMIDMARLEAALASGKLRDFSGEVPEGLADARELAVEFLDRVESELGPDRLVLGGFSQGAMLALDIALRTERNLAGLVLMSGTLLSADEWLPLMSERSGTPVVLSHGARDELLSFEMAERLRDHMREAGLEVDWIEFAGGHEIPSNVLAGVKSLLERVQRASG